jgi:integrase
LGGGREEREPTRTAGEPQLSRYRSIVSVVFEYAAERDLVESNPACGLKRADESRRAREEYLTVEQFWAVFDCAPTELQLMIAIGAHTGLRPGAIRELRWRHVDLDAGTLLAMASYAKNAKPQLFHLDPAIVEVLRDMRDRAPSGADRVFLTKTGVPWSRGWLCRVMRKTIDSCEAIPAEIRPKITFYVLRHTFASLLEQDGLGEGKLQKAMGHSDPRLTRRYAHLGPDGPMKEVGKRIGRIFKFERLNEVREGPRKEHAAG